MGPEAKNGRLRELDSDLFEQHYMMDWIYRAGRFTLEQRRSLQSQLPTNPGLRRKIRIAFTAFMDNLDEESVGYLNQGLRTTEYREPVIHIERKILDRLRGKEFERDIGEIRRASLSRNGMVK